MDSFSLPIQVRWSDIDQNRHLRHSAYYDFGATARVACFGQMGLTTTKLGELNIGPILLREEAIFKKEISFEDKLTIDVAFTKATADFGRWSIRHQIVRGDGKLAAILNMDGAWIDISKRRLTVPNDFVRAIMIEMPRASDFQWMEGRAKGQ